MPHLHLKPHSTEDAHTRVLAKLYQLFFINVISLQGVDASEVD